jgi:DNA-binding LacI/PurR family transcriptional regulator
MKTQTPVSKTSVKRASNIQDVAAALGMHKSTVSQGLSGKGNVSAKTRARIIAAAREMGYQPNPLAQRLANSGANNTVCLCAGTLDLGFMTEKALMLQRELAERGLETPIYTLAAAGERQAESQAAQMRQLCRQQPRAVLCSVQSVCDEVFPELERYQREGGIVVTYDAAVPLACDQVVFDREDNAYQAARYLIQKGHRRIGLGLAAARRPDGNFHDTQNARVVGFSRALEAAGLEVCPEWIFDELNYEIGGAHLASHYLALKERPTGLCIVNDYMALAFMMEMIQAGIRIPEDLGLVGLNNQPIAAYCPVPLTSVSQPKERIVHAVIQLLEERMQGLEAPSRTVTICGEIIERESVMTLR